MLPPLPPSLLDIPCDHCVELIALPKRTLTLIIGAVFSLTTLVPNYRDYRLLSFIGICSTFYTACYIVAASAANGPIENVEYTAPTSLYGFFTAFTNIIFMFGAHTVCVDLVCLHVVYLCSC